MSDKMSEKMAAPIFNYNEETQTEKLARKSKDSPFMVAGLIGLVGAVGYGAYHYKKRGAMSTSVYLMQFRVIAQGTVIGALTGGVLYSMYKDYLEPKKDA